MPRPARLLVPGVAVHVIQHCRNRAASFKNDNDYLMYLAHLRHLARKYECALHAYCVMADHVQLLVTPHSAKACIALMRDLGQRYERRLRFCIAPSPLYVLGCYRYIESNPVRAAMVDHPTGYLWSSYAVNSGMRSDPLITFHAEYVALAEDIELRHAAYRALFDPRPARGRHGAIHDAIDGGYPAARPAKSPEALYALEEEIGALTPN